MGKMDVDYQGRCCLLEPVLVIIQEVGANLLLMNMDGNCMVMSLGFISKNNPTMRKNQLTRPSIGVIWRRRRKTKKKRKRSLRNRLRKRTWRLAFSLLTVCQSIVFALL